MYVSYLVYVLTGLNQTAYKFPAKAVAETTSFTNALHCQCRYDPVKCWFHILNSHSGGRWKAVVVSNERA
jgi:hypothetical protein